MFRTIGFLVGFSLASIGLLFLVDAGSALRTRDAAVELIQSIDIELPERLLSSRGQPPVPAAPRPTSALTQTAAPEAETPQPGAQEDPGEQPQPRPDAPHLTTKPQIAETTTAPPVPAHAREQLDAVPGAEPDPTPARNWYVFWSPFGTKYAASGFAERLTGLTGLDFTVIREGPGEYQVAFAYADENERSAGLAMIETQTGLRLRETQP